MPPKSKKTSKKRRPIKSGKSLPALRRERRERDIDKLRKQHVTRAGKREAKRDTKIETVLAGLRKKHGADVVTTVAGGKRIATEGISTGWPELDDLLTGETDENRNTIPGTGIGMPRGRIIEIFGPEFSGKTTLVLHMIAAVQRAGGRAVFIDAEHAFDPKYAANLGVDLETLLFNQPDNAEQAIQVGLDFVKSGAVDLVVVDSVSALEPQKEAEGDVGDTHVGLQARLMGQSLRMLVSPIKRHGVIFIFINQIRMKIGVRFGNPETTSGGNPLRFYASIRLDMRNVKSLKKGERKIGHRARIKTIKNKVAPPFREVHADVEPNHGIVKLYTDPGHEAPEEDA